MSRRRSGSMFSRLVHRPRRVVGLWRREGAQAVLRAFCSKLGVRVAAVFERSLASPPELVEPKLDADFEFLELASAEAFGKHSPEVGREIAIDRLNRGDRCFVAWAGDHIASSRWVRRGALSEDNLPFSFILPDDHAYDYQAYTSPDMRQLHLSSASGTRLCAELSKEGFSTLVELVFTANPAAVRTTERIGCHRSGVIVILGRRAVWISYGGRLWWRHRTPRRRPLVSRSTRNDARPR